MVGTLIDHKNDANVQTAQRVVLLKSFEHFELISMVDKSKNHGKLLSTTVVHAREPPSFWRENVVAVVSLPRVLASMSWWRKQVIKCYKFSHLAIWRGLNLLQWK